ncbi:hypothetical protein [uncultured Erythrobacter sp.]|uniref:hypothetical protein n=1 Tax=uncultured Erythrobacter sp. TaxID=263913 RepID=UPI00262C8164|nr:hypothetical protein [uncultured Erythrobacter sp.]
MKATAEQLATLQEQIAAARSQTALSDTEIGSISGVHPSQVGRIVRGEFKTISFNVVQVCKALGIAVESAPRNLSEESDAWLRLEASLRGLWDKTPEGADKIVKVLDTISTLRQS